MTWKNIFYFITISISLIIFFVFVLKSTLLTAIATTTPIVGIYAIWVQIKKDADIVKAQFIYNLNLSFSDNVKITKIYNKLKEFRDDETVKFTEVEGREMGDYIMFFETMNYLVEDSVVSIKIINQLFSSRFFIMANNPFVQEYQLSSVEYTEPIFKLYSKWYNHKKKLNHDIPYNKYSLEEAFPSNFERNRKGKLIFKRGCIT